ncbi:cytochrome c1 [Frateuria defendens]|uniref:cytochrome c1 n=1 Tax=Frateuria defendens TaxID=2219559 RepID=UPI00066FC5F2|nr:cytochrome c1 [Frateuria defendens]
MTKRALLSIVLAFGLLAGSRTLRAAEEGALPPAGTNVGDRASLQRGARLFFNYCVGCHSIKYARYSRIAEDLGLGEQEVMDNLNFTGAKFQDPVVSHMPADLAQQWFGKAPPDLSLEVRAKTADWVYAYLNGFYLDPTRPVGWNNRIFPNASMPFPLWELQGVQVAVRQPGSEEIDRLSMAQPGKLSLAEYQRAARDLTAFLEYVSEPAALQRHRYGIWVLLFLVGFTLLAYALKREYWKDVH